jgi:hypothetical protein
MPVNRLPGPICTFETLPPMKMPSLAPPGPKVLLVIVMPEP